MNESLESTAKTFKDEDEMEYKGTRSLFSNKYRQPKDKFSKELNSFNLEND